MIETTENGSRLRLISVSQPALDLTAAGFLRLAAGQPRVAWQAAHSQQAWAGFGVAAELKAWGETRFETLETAARQLFEHALIINPPNPGAGPRLFGGFAFRDDFIPDNTWAVFHPAHFILPHFQFFQDGEQRWLTVNALLPGDANLEQEVELLKEALTMRCKWLLKESERFNSDDQPDRLQPITSFNVDVRFPLSFDRWNEMIARALDAMQGTLRKVVLARMCEVVSSQRLDVDAALENLTRHYPDCFRFLFEPQPEHAFWGATPELLVHTQERQAVSMALAGSIGRGQSEDPDQRAEEDELLASQLLNSRKDRREHDLVAQEVCLRFQKIGAQVQMDSQPQVLRLRNIQHLYTPVRAVLPDDIGVLPLAKLLHPTPALGGLPQEAAMEFIRESELAPRGWYAAPVGWIDQHMNGAFGVAIRSAITQHERAWLYAGAGIVPGSQADQEWEETALKFRPALQALGLERDVLVIA
jgi:menaquinone-specific isochorismate synthase